MARVGKPVQQSAIPARSIPWWKKVLFATLTCVAFFALIECILWLCGVQPVLYEEDPYVGFSKHVPLFVEQADHDGRHQMVTAANKRKFFNTQQFLKDKPQNVYRIFCLGGSTTFGRPYDDTTSFCGWLRELLTVADPSHKWEVINAGGISYASYRVALLMEELAQYEPDLFVVYTGHNEFLESRTYGPIAETPPVVRRLNLLLNHTRTAAAVKKIIDLGKRPLNQMPAEVETILDQSVGPDAYERDDELQSRILHHFRLNLDRMVSIARSAGANVVFVVPASNLLDCSPFKSQPSDQLNSQQQSEVQRYLATADRAMRDGRWSVAASTLDQALAIDDRNATLYYLRGRALYQSGDYEAAAADLRRAQDEDVCPLRALSSIVQSVKQVAEEREVDLVDFEALVRDRSVHHVPGNDFFLDHVHPTIEGHRLLAEALVDELIREQIVTPCSQWGPDAVDAVRQRVESRLNPRTEGRAFRNLSMVLGWAGKFKEARQLALQAIEKIPNDCEAHYRAGRYEEALGNTQRAMRHYQDALRIDPSFVAAANNLGAILARQGQLEKAITQFRHVLTYQPQQVEARENLARAIEQLRQRNSAGSPNIDLPHTDEPRDR